MPKCFRLDAVQKQYIESIKVNNNGAFSGNEWDKLKNEPEMKAIKSDIRSKLHAIQKGFCAYCGNKYYVTSEAHIEHIAAKATNRHPEFMFKEHNLVLACQYCNGFKKKGNKETVITKSAFYNKCLFNIVHPYFDNPDDHYQYVGSANEEVLITFKTPKGDKSIELFKLADNTQAEARAKDAIYKDYKLKPKHERLIDLVGLYRIS